MHRRDDVEQARVDSLIGDLGANHPIDEVSGTWLVFIANGEDQVDVWQASFLELYNVNVSYYYAEYVGIEEQTLKYTELKLEDTCRDVWPKNTSIVFSSRL